MVKMQNCGITIEVPAKEIAWYKRAGYEVVVEESPALATPDAPADEPESINEDGPAVKAPRKRRNQ